MQFYTENGRFAFLNPLWGLGATNDVHLRLIGKRVADFHQAKCDFHFLLVLTELFSLGVTAEALQANIN